MPLRHPEGVTTMITKQDKNATRKKRHARVRTKISGTAARPRLKRFPFKQTYLCTIDR